jgi:hypothetical protein
MNRRLEACGLNLCYYFCLFVFKSLAQLRGHRDRVLGNSRAVEFRVVGLAWIEVDGSRRKRRSEILTEESELM